MFLHFKSSGAVSWIVVFLGNPGQKYENTRHNVGFMTAEVCERATGVSISKARFRALTAQTRLEGQGVLLMKPQTFMNLSGEAVAKAAKFYKVRPEHIIVVSDDVSLPVGKLRVRTKGSAGGHNGLKNIISNLNTDAFPRIKVGVGAPPHPDYDMVDWVLGTFKGDDLTAVTAASERCWEAVCCYIKSGPEATMSKYN